MPQQRHGALEVSGGGQGIRIIGAPPSAVEGGGDGCWRARLAHAVCTRGGERAMLVPPEDVLRAHHGVLFLDELPEFRRHVLEVLPIRLRRASQEYNRRRVIDPAALAAWVAFLEVRVGEQSR